MRKELCYKDMKKRKAREDEDERRIGTALTEVCVLGLVHHNALIDYLSSLLLLPT